MISPNSRGALHHAKESVGSASDSTVRVSTTPVSGATHSITATEAGTPEIRTNGVTDLSHPIASDHRATVTGGNSSGTTSIGTTSTGTISHVASYPVAIWMVPSREYQWKLWETSTALANLVKTSINKTVQGAHVPAFQPHATLCTGEIAYTSLSDLEDKLTRLQRQVETFRASLTGATHESPRWKIGPIGFGTWWSQFLYIHLDTERWPFGTNRSEAMAAFNVLSNRFGLSTLKDACGTNHDVMPHISLLYCPNDRITALNNQISRDEWTQTIRNLPWESDISFEAIQVATPMPYSTQWEDLVNGDRLPFPVQWRIIYTCRLGGDRAKAEGKLTRVVSGGQTGPDTAGLRAALQCGLKTGGWCPPDGRNEAGEIPAEFMLKRTSSDASPDAPSIPRSLRTLLNVRDSDATLILWPEGLALDERRYAGTLYTSWTAAKLGKPILFSSPNPEDPAGIATVVHWLREHSVGTLNVAGPLESSSPCIGENSYRFLLNVFEQVKSETTIDDLHPGAR